MRLTSQSIGELKLWLNTVLEQGLALKQLQVEPFPVGRATLFVRVAGGTSKVSPLVLAWRNGHASPRTHPLWVYGTERIEAVRSRIPADRRGDEEVQRALAAGDFLADILPFVDVGLAPFVTAGQTGDHRSFGREFQVEMTADGIADAISKVGGSLVGHIAKAAVKVDLDKLIQEIADSAAAKTIKELVLEWIGDAAGDGIREMRGRAQRGNVE